jgi:hypothetical protein
VTSGRISLENKSCVPQSAQKRDVSGLDKRHFGHVTAIADPFNRVWLKIIKKRRKSQLWGEDPSNGRRENPAALPPSLSPLSALPLPQKKRERIGVPDERFSNSIKISQR